MGMYASYLRGSAAQLEFLIKNPDEAKEYFLEGHCDDPLVGEVDIGRSWHLIHFLLTGVETGGPYPWSAVIQSTESLDAGDFNLSYLRPAEVKEVNAALETVSEEALWSRFDTQRVNEARVYPAGLWDESAKEHVLASFAELKHFYRAASAAGQAVLQSIG
jgi:hypothetical protein